MSTGPAGDDPIYTMQHSSTGPDSTVLAMFPSSSTGTAPPPLVVDITELMGSYEAIQAQEVADRTTLSVLLNETRESLRPQMFAWAAAGFPTSYIVQQFTVTPPSVCSDGVSRTDVSTYVAYILGKGMGEIIEGIQALCVGVLISYSFSGNTLRIHVSKTS